LGGIPAVVCGFVLGLASDLLGWGPVGVGALVGTLAAAAFSYFRGQIYEKSLVVPSVFAAAATLFKLILGYILLAATSGLVSFGWHVVGRIALGAGTTAVASIPLLFAYWRLLPQRRV